MTYNPFDLSKPLQKMEEDHDDDDEEEEEEEGSIYLTHSAGGHAIICTELNCHGSTVCSVQWTVDTAI